MGFWGTLTSHFRSHWIPLNGGHVTLTGQKNTEKLCPLQGGAPVRER